MNLQSTQDIVDSCRFCFMCRHVCTVSRFTGEEEKSPRAKALLLSMVLRGSMELSDDIAEMMFGCCLCGYCTMWCEGGWDFMKAAVVARQDLVEQGFVPERVALAAEKLTRDGTVYPSRARGSGFLKGLPAEGRQVLLLFGDAAVNGDYAAAKAALNLVRKTGEEPSVLEIEAQGGLSLYFLGFVGEGRKRIRALFDSISASGCRQVIALTPEIYFLLTQTRYPDIQFVDSAIEVLHIASYLSDRLLDGRIQVRKGPASKTDPRKAVLIDSDYLVRLVPDPIVEVPRKILARIPGIEQMELIWTGEKAISPGNPLFAEVDPEVASIVAREKVNELIEAEAELVVTLSGDDAFMLRKGLEENGRTGAFEITGLLELLDGVT